MRLILTLLCRDEADIIESVLDFHLSHGVDMVIATDNGSNDGTRTILERYRKTGSLHLIDEPSYTHDQGPWVTRMARLATEQYGADWVINADADEFWWPCEGNLNTILAATDPAVAALSVERYNYLPPDPLQDPALPFHRTMHLRERRSLNSLGSPLPPKACHRGMAAITVDDGNHGVRINGEPVHSKPCSGIEILHFPVRSYQQFERKIRQGAEALERNSRTAPTGIGSTWRHLYHHQLMTGQLEAYYHTLRPSLADVQQALTRGDLIDDRRLQPVLAGKDSVAPPPQP